MNDFPLTMQHIFWRIEKLYSDSEIVSRSEEGIERKTYSEFATRVRKFSSFLQSLKLSKGDRVASIEWNTRRHLELYFATINMGYVLHTINVRFHPNEIEYVINHANDRYAFISPEFESLTKNLKTSLNGIFLLDNNFDKVIDMQKPINEFPQIDERDEAIMCYTSGTTGRSKGVVYTHRTIYLHSLTLLAKDAIGISRKDSVLVVVPMFHINGWDLPFSALMTGSKLVLPGPRPKPKDLAELIEKEKVTIAAGAPTVWIDFLNFIEKENYDISSLKIVVTGGAEPPKIIAEKFNKMGVHLYHAWGMTETEAITTVNQNQEMISSQGIPLPGIEIKLMGLDREEELPWDSKSIGELWVSGAWIAKEYYKEIEKTRETFKLINSRTWMRTGDIVTINNKGYIKIVDRAKDLIKSGGEWISSIDLENAITGYYKVFEAAVVGVKDEKWGERPIALVKPKKEYEGNITENEIKQYLLSLNKFPRWWIPDKIIFVDEIPKTSTGKLDKKVIREMLKNII